MSKRTLFLIFSLFLVTFTLLIIALYQPRAQKVTETIAPMESVDQTTLSFGELSMATPSAISTTNYSLPVKISSGKNQVMAVQLELQYDPKIITDVKITPGSFFPKPEILLDQIDAKTGRISYAFGASINDQGVIGNGIVATITFSPVTETPEKTAIIFLPKTLVTAQGINESVLKETVNGLFTVGEIISSPSATKN